MIALSVESVPFLDVLLVHGESQIVIGIVDHIVERNQVVSILDLVDSLPLLDSEPEERLRLLLGLDGRAVDCDRVSTRRLLLLRLCLLLRALDLFDGGSRLMQRPVLHAKEAHDGLSGVAEVEIFVLAPVGRSLSDMRLDHVEADRI